jgi:hypothetical protein
MKVVYALTNTLVTLPSGEGVSIHAGEHWPASDPIVKAHPSLFSDDPRTGLRISAPLAEDEDQSGEEDDAEEQEAPVEQATRAPGEKRTTRRGR